jgi:hypothetical protein
VQRDLACQWAGECRTCQIAHQLRRPWGGGLGAAQLRRGTGNFSAGGELHEEYEWPTGWQHDKDGGTLASHLSIVLARYPGGENRAGLRGDLPNSSCTLIVAVARGEPLALDELFRMRMRTRLPLRC